MSWLDIFKRTSSPEELYKKRQTELFVESLKDVSIISKGGTLYMLGLSEHGANKLLKEGKEPNHFGEKVMTKSGELVPWVEWKEINDAGT